jgi:hypothetical protein
MKGNIEIQQVYKFSIPVFIKINAWDKPRN